MTVDKESLLPRGDFCESAGRMPAPQVDRQYRKRGAAGPRPGGTGGILRRDNLNPAEPNVPCGVERVAKDHRDMNPYPQDAELARRHTDEVL